VKSIGRPRYKGLRAELRGSPGRFATNIYFILFMFFTTLQYSYLTCSFSFKGVHGGQHTFPRTSRAGRIS